MSGSYRLLVVVVIAPPFELVVVDNFGDGDAVNRCPIQATIRLLRWWISRRPEDESVRMVEVDGKVSVSIPGKFVAPAGELPHISQARRGSELL